MPCGKAIDRLSIQSVRVTCLLLLSVLLYGCEPSTLCADGSLEVSRDASGEVRRVGDKCNDTDALAAQDDTDASASDEASDESDDESSDVTPDPDTTPDTGVSITLSGAAGDGEATLSWTTSPAIIDIQIFYDTDADPQGRERFAILSTTSISYTATGLENDTAYWFWVKYRTSDGVWHNSNALNVTPRAEIVDAPMLPQEGNPLRGSLDDYTDWLTGNLSDDKELADNIITWQLPQGGFYKNSDSVYQNPWDGNSTRSGWKGEDGVELGTIDNEATVKELLFLADVYQRSGEDKYKDAARKAMDFLLTMQYASGGWPQVYPARTGGGSYSNQVTYNDDAMVRVMVLLDLAIQQQSPLDGDVLSANQRDLAAQALQKGIAYTLEAQIVQNGKKTVWCAQHDPETYEPRGARSYELPSKSGSESVRVIAFLMTQPQTAEIEASVKAGLAWFRDPNVQEEDTAYIKRASNSSDDDYNPIQAKAGSTLWYRFYEVESDVPFFSGRLPTDNPPGMGKQYDIMSIEPERRYGYSWGGSYAKSLLNYAESVGY